ncbi:type II toxin-antitoxin system VapC family toxin [bacterium]|nr:type II toxin-antitoxin system VapC family toxin [candidate division CSSED10-310 bacterium]
MNYLLDTCVLTELLSDAPDPRVTDWLRKIPSSRLFINALTIGELRKAITTLPDSTHKDTLIEWMTELVREYSDRILPICTSTADNWGLVQIHLATTGQAVSFRDSLIVATAYTHHLILVTRKTAAFEAGIIPILNPWTIASSPAEGDSA